MGSLGENSLVPKEPVERCIRRQIEGCKDLSEEQGRYVVCTTPELSCKHYSWKESPCLCVCVGNLWLRLVFLGGGKGGCLAGMRVKEL